MSGRRLLGPACDECRRRKLRCDGLHPQCSVCRETDMVCEFTQHNVRGPKKGHLKALKNRIVQLEAALEARLSPNQPNHRTESPVDLQTINENDARAIPLAPGLEDLPSTPPLELGLNTISLLGNHGSDFSSVATTSPPHLTNIIRAELDQLYLDRVHPSIPILHQRRYLSWTKSNAKIASRQCLQYAMWTLASLLSAHSQNLVEPLYRYTKRMLEGLSVGADEDGPTLAQAWVLVVMFEFMRTYHRQAWLSAGRAFRLVQAMRYHEIDGPVERHGHSSPQDGDWIDVEERRRIFWMAYLLDHMISMRGDWPITLNEHVICTRLPVSDAEFQSGSHQLGPFLSEAMSEPLPTDKSSFNECLILATVCGRTLLQRQQHHISKAYGDTAMDLTEQHRWLDDILVARLQVLAQSYPAPTESNDPLLVFANIFSQVTVIHFCKMMVDTTVTTSPVNSDFMNHSAVTHSHSRALEASTNIIGLASTLRELPTSRVHPLTPIPLFLCAEFLYDEIDNEIFRSRLQDLFHILGDLKNVNHPDKSYLDLLPRSSISKTADLLANL